MEKAMTIESSLSRIRYVGNGVSTIFSIPFPYLTNNDGTAQISVYEGDSDTPLVEGVDYTIVGLGQQVAGEDEQVEYATYEERFESGDVIFEVAPAQGVAVAMIRNVPQTQGVVFVEGEKFPAQDFENALDKLTMEVQEVKENLQRAIVLPPTSTEKPIEIRDEIVDLAKQANKTASEAIVVVENAKEEINRQVVNATQELIDAVDDAVETVNEAAEKNIEKSRIWAEGEQEEVQELGGELSSRGFADFAYAIANAPEDVPLDNSNLIALDIVKGEKGDKGDKGDDGVDGVDGKDGAGRNVGDIFYTTRTDTALNGAVVCDGAVYDIGDFSGEQSVGNLLANGSIPYVSLSEHASQVSSSGVCRVFGWDGGAEFKVPKIPAILLTKTQADVIGDGGTFKLANSAAGAPANVSTYGNASVDGTNWMHAGFNNSTLYVSTTGDSGMLTKFPVIQYRAMVQLATTMTDEALVTATTTLHEARSLADEAVTRLNGFDETVDDAEIQINALVEDALERIEHAGDLNTNHMSITYWE